MADLVATDEPAVFERGRLVLRRHFMRADLLSRVWVGRVAADDEHGLWLWVPSGSAFRDIGAADGRPFREVPFGEWGATAKAMRELHWQGQVLMLHPRSREREERACEPRSAKPDVTDCFSVWWFFDRAGRFTSWYVNLEDPGTRWDDGVAAGIDTVDHDLDVVVAPDRGWRWKDEDEFLDRLAWPDIYWVADEEAVRAEGRRVVKLIEAGAFPFDGTRCDFRPDPAWSLPVTMPPGWDRPRAYPPTFRRPGEPWGDS